MLRTMAITTGFVVMIGVVWAADEPRTTTPAQPKADPAKQPEKANPGKGDGDRAKGTGAQPGGFGAQPANPFATRASSLARAEEEADVLDAQRDIRLAHVKAADVGVQAVKLKLNRIAQLRMANTVSTEELEQAKIEVEAAIAHVAIRQAELKEIDVKLKYAKKRLEDAKAAPVRPVPNFRNPPADPKLVDPAPVIGRAFYSFPSLSRTMLSARLAVRL